MRRPCIFAHRGASCYAPENTIAAFNLAIIQGADAIELDAKLCADGYVVIVHDQTIDRTTSASGKVSEMTLAELQKLDAGSHFDIAFRDEKIPTLDQVLEAVGKRIYINIELSNYASKTDSLPEKTADIIRRHSMNDWVMFSSFNPLALIRVKKILPDIPVGLLALSGGNGRWARSWLGSLVHYQALHPHYSDVNPELVNRLHRQGARIHPFTVNGEPEMRALQELDVDGIITDDTMLAQKIFHPADIPVTIAGQS